MSDASNDSEILAKIVNQLDLNASAEVAATIIVTGGYSLTGSIIGVEAYKKAFDAQSAGTVQQSQTFQGQVGSDSSMKNLITRDIKDASAGSGYLSFRSDYVMGQFVQSNYWRIRLSSIVAWSLGHAPVFR